MTTYVLIPGAGSDSWYWHLVVPRLAVLGHDAVAVDLPVSDETADFERYADVVVDAIGDRRDLILVAQSLGGFTAPLVCARLPVQLLVLVAAMVPRPGESAGDWWANTGHVFPDPFDPAEVFTHDLDPQIAAAANEHMAPRPAGRSRIRGRSRRGRMSRPGSCCAATIASSPPTSSGAWCRNAWGSPPTRWAAGTSRPSPGPMSSSAGSSATAPSWRPSDPLRPCSRRRR